MFLTVNLSEKQRKRKTRRQVQAVERRDDLAIIVGGVSLSGLSVGIRNELMIRSLIYR